MHIYLRCIVKMCYQQKHVYLPLYLIIEIQEKTMARGGKKCMY